MKYQKYAQGAQDVVVNTEAREVIAIFFVSGLAEKFVHDLMKAEGLPEEDDNRPLHWKTGVKVINRVDHYQTHCKCPNCKTTQTKFLSRWSKTTVCSECSFDLSVQIATDEFGKRDDFGNFFVAYRLG